MKICVVGGGAAGMMAALAAAEKGGEVTLIERNEKLGKKIYITGKGRCNLTNKCTPEVFLTNVVTNPKFLYSAINILPPEKTISSFESMGLQTKLERGGRVFPLSDKASDVTKALENRLRSKGVEIRLNEKLLGIERDESTVTSLTTTSGIVLFDKLILATGGVSYPGTGSDGSVFNIVKSLGHTVTELYPSLTDILIEDNLDLEGLSLINVTLEVVKSGKKLFSKLGEMLFTRDGISGPLVLSASAYLPRKDMSEVTAIIDLKPGLSPHQLEMRILRDFSSAPNKLIKNILSLLMPDRLIMPVLERAGINPEKPANSITTAERAALVNAVKNFSLKVKGMGGFERAVVTKGGVSVKEIVPSTMRSKLCKNLYFCGEMIDVDALTGGFNLQIAFSTGYLAGVSAATENL